MSKLIFSIAGIPQERALDLVNTIGPRVYAVKIHDLFDTAGPGVIQKFLDAGARRVWIDAKFKDIPKTVKRRTAALAAAGASIITVHTDGEVDMMRAAKEGAPDAMILGVTILTSLEEDQVQLLAGQPVRAAVLYRARLARLAEIDGVVCSPHEVGSLKKRWELHSLSLVVPGTRSAGKAAGDQKRVTTPKEAIQNGATYLVVESQVIDAPDPLAELRRIEEEVAA